MNGAYEPPGGIEEFDEDEDEAQVPVQSLNSNGHGQQGVYYGQEYAHQPEDALRLRWECGIEVDGEDVSDPIRAFNQANLSPELLFSLHQGGFTNPTPVQMQALPCVMGGRDIICTSSTGSGKTLAYTAPLIMMLTYLPWEERAAALIVAPTRELADQIGVEIERLLAGVITATGATTAPTDASVALATGFNVVRLVGGVSLAPQLEALGAGAHVLVATPGRLLDLLEKGAVDVMGVRYLVLDEADRMLSMGMEDQLRRIVAHVSLSETPRQTLLFSATMPAAIERLARTAVVNPITIRVGEANVAAATVRQEVIFLAGHQKKQRLLDVLRRTPAPPVMVFCNAHHTVDYVTAVLRDEQFHVAAFHSGKPQDHRFRVMRAFRDNGVDVLVTTDLASRGIDRACVMRVINYDMPHTIEDYIHRIGRTGRAGMEGLATSFLTWECQCAAELKDLLEKAGETIPTQLANNLERFGSTKAPTTATATGDYSVGWES